jgi:hypothetical protein
MEHFIYRWQHAGDIFPFMTSIRNPNEWKAFWENTDLTIEQIDIAMDNFIDGVKSGAIERRFIPKSPDTFVLNGHIQRSLEPYKKLKAKDIASDEVDDFTKYFEDLKKPEDKHGK